MSKLATARIGYCPDCGDEVRFRKAPHLGKVVTCGHCETSLEVVSRMPIELDWAFEEPIEDDEDDDFNFKDTVFNDFDFDNDDWDEDDDDDDWDDEDN